MVTFRLQSCVWVVCILLYSVVSSYAFEISTVSGLDDVEVIVNAAWTNTSEARIIPPGAFDHDTLQ